MKRAVPALTMGEQPEAWPDDDADPFAQQDSIDSEEPQTEQDEHLEEPENDENPDSETEEIVPVDESWTLPVRVKPVLALNGEEVVEFPLNETLDGRKNTSLVLNDDLLRIIEVSYDDDGQRRLNVKAVLKNELTGFSHYHNELMHKHQWLWITSFIAGLILIFIPYFGFLGQLLIGVGLFGWTYMHLEIHTLEFSTSGSKHKVTLTGYGSNRPKFRISMALIGPAVADYMESGNFDVDSINSLHESISIPTEPAQTPQPTPQFVIVDDNNPSLEQLTNQALPSNSFDTPPSQMIQQTAPVETQQTMGPPITTTNQNDESTVEEESNTPPPLETTTEAINSTNTSPDLLPAPAPMSPPIPPTPTSPPPPTAMTSPLPTPKPVSPPPSPPLPPQTNTLPPPTLPPPLPPVGMMSTPIDMGEIPLDAPLPEAPEIAVKAAPITESLSTEEQNELLEELR